MFLLVIFIENLDLISKFAMINHPPVMKRFFIILLMGIIFVSIASAQPKSSEKALWKTAKKTARTMTKEGWKADSTLPLENLLYDHYIILQKEGNYELVGSVAGNTKIRTLNQGQQWAASMAAVSYAKLSGQSIKGRMTAELGSDLDGSSAIDTFYEKYESKVEKEIKGELKRSFSIFRDKADGSLEYRSYYIVDEVKAQSTKVRAMREALEESDITKTNADRISAFINEAFDEGNN